MSALDAYSLYSSTSGKLALRAKALFVEGTKEASFEACVLLHEAARVRRFATSLLVPCPPITRLASSVEECGCYVEGRDPLGAAKAWVDVLRARRSVGAKDSNLLLTRLAPKFEGLQRDFVRALSASPSLRMLQERGRTRELTKGEIKSAKREVSALVARFPGSQQAWWMRYRVAEHEREKAAAWDAISRCRRLDPADTQLLATSILTAAWALSSTAAEEQLASVRPILDDADAQVCLSYALAEIGLARRRGAKGSQRERWRRASKATQLGLGRARRPALRDNLEATALLLEDLLGGRKPTTELLYLAGLAETASRTKRTENVADVLTAHVAQGLTDHEAA